MFLVFFLYGLSFFALGLAVLVYWEPQRVRAPLQRVLYWVGLFALTHGANEWLDMFHLVPERVPYIERHISHALLPLSFVFLSQAWLSARPAASWALRALPWGLLVLGGVVAFGVPLDSAGHSVLARYMLGVPGTLLAALALAQGARRLRSQNHLRGARQAEALAGLFVAYGVLAGVVVPRVSLFPASVLNQEGFAALFGVPVQVFRSALAVAMAIAAVQLLRSFDRYRDQALTQSEQRYRRLNEVSPLAVAVMVEGRITMVNPAAVSLLGVADEGALVGQNAAELIAEAGRVACTARFAQAARGERVPLFEERIVRPDGSEFDAELSGVPVLIDNAPGALFVFSDITARKRDALELQHHRRRLEEQVAERTAELTAAVDEVTALRGLIPVCAWCKKVRDDEGFWDQIESYLERHTDVRVTHGICPSCKDKVIPPEVRESN